MTVSINGVDKQGVYVNGVQVKQALDAANETVNKGVYDATTLSAVDTDLATGNIKNGITIFGKVGSADVRDISDATAIAAEVITGETFYAVSGSIRTGTMPIVALAEGANAYPAGYHAGAASLTAVDAQLVTGNIKYGITIFGVAGSTNVRDSSDANATATRVRSGYTFYAGGGARKTGTLATVAITAANDDYPAGYHAGNVGGLDAIDADLAPANIKSGKTIFGKAGSTDVRDVSDANALVGEVKTGRTFYAVGGAIKTGTLATVALDPALNEYPAGYHAGAASLTAVDADLATGNIKSGITIFNVAGHNDVRDVSDANALVGEVKTGRTFYAVGGARKTGTMPTKAIVAANDLYEAGFHAGNPGGLDAIDVHLAPENIKKDVVIFGKVGTVTPGVTFSSYHHYEDMAASTTYTPPAHAQALILNEDSKLIQTQIHVEFYDGAGWVNGHVTVTYEGLTTIFQDNDQNIRIANGSGTTAYKISLTGVTWDAGFTDYHYYEDMAAHTTYTPPAGVIAAFFCALGYLFRQDYIELQFYNGSSWIGSAWATEYLQASALVGQDTDQNMRISNETGVTQKISLTGVIV